MRITRNWSNRYATGEEIGWRGFLLHACHNAVYQQLEDYLRTDSSIDIQQRAPAGIISDNSPGTCFAASHVDPSIIIIALVLHGRFD
jgi:hypothetical protein